MLLRLTKNIVRDLWLKYKHKKRVCAIAGHRPKEKDYFREDVSVEVFIPALEKDLEVLPYVVLSLRKFLRHEISSISVVSPASETMRRACEEMNVQLVDEQDIAPKRKQDIHYMHAGSNRAGWMYQQLLKFACVLGSRSKYVFICDADTVFVRDQGFIGDTGICFDVPIENHSPYKRAYEKITGLSAPGDFSITSHHIMVEKVKIESLVKLMEEHTKLPWWEALCSTIDEVQGACHSDYDTMGYFSLNNDLKNLRYGENVAFSRRYLWVTRLPGISRIYRTISFHAYFGY